jgi:hypothetical protein
MVIPDMVFMLTSMVETDLDKGYFIKITKSDVTVS